MGEIRFIVAGRYIDGSGADVRRNVFLAVQGGVITAIGPATDLSGNDEAAVDDFSHCTILPPLVDCSLSLLQSPSVDSTVRISFEEADPAEKKEMLERHLQDCHAHGVLGVADGNDRTGLVKWYRQKAGPGRRVEIRTSGKFSRKANGEIGSPVGGDFLKIRYSSDIEAEDGPDPRLTREELCRIVQHRGEKKTVVVANGPRLVEEAIKVGCDAVEQGYDMGEDNLRQMAKKNVLWIPSILRARNALDGAGGGGEVCCRFSLRYVSPGKSIPGAEVYWKKMLIRQLSQLRLARKLGVTTAVGTGAGSIGILHGESMVEELKLFIKAGYSVEEAIRCASENGAEFFGMEKLGTLAVGQRATFLMTRGTVKQLPRKLAYLEGIYIDGMPSST